MLRRALVIVVCASVLAGCAGHSVTMHDVRDALAENDLEAAHGRLAEAGKGTDDLLFALEDGVLLHYLGDYALSNARFEFAEQEIDDLYTKSLTRQVLSLLSSDLALKFEPRGIENFLINYYRSLSYVHSDEEDEALVEIRKLASKLRFSRDVADGRPYRSPPFFDYLVGLGLERDDPSNAYVSLKLAEASFFGAGREPPAGLVEDLTRLARSLGHPDDLDVYERRYGSVYSGANDHEERPAAAGAAEAAGEVVLFVEEGFVAPIEELRAYIPIIESRVDVALSEDSDARAELAQTLAREYADGMYHGVRPGHKSAHVSYIMPLAFPAPGYGEPAFDYLTVTSGGRHVAAEPVLDVSALQIAALEDRLPGIYVKTILRAFLKYAAAEELRKKAEKESGEDAGDIVGWLGNAINVMTERADTRAWLGLPHRIWVARLALPPGVHELSIRFDGVAPIELGHVDVRSGSRTFHSFRVF